MSASLPQAVTDLPRLNSQKVQEFNGVKIPPQYDLPDLRGGRGKQKSEGRAYGWLRSAVLGACGEGLGTGLRLVEPPARRGAGSLWSKDKGLKADESFTLFKAFDTDC